MRADKHTYTLAALNATGYASNATGASWPLDSTVGPDDGTAHQVTIKGDAATNHSAKTAIITGTDAEGRALTETINLPNGAVTVTSTKYFKTVTSVVPSATIGADTMDIGWNAVLVTPMYPVDRTSSSGAALSVDITGTVTFSCQQTVDDPFDSTPPFFILLGTASQTADYIAFASPGVTAVRVQVASHTSGVVAISNSQGT